MGELLQAGQGNILTSYSSGTPTGDSLSNVLKSNSMQDLDLIPNGFRN